MSKYIIIPASGATVSILNLTTNRKLENANKSNDANLVMLEIVPGNERFLLEHFHYTDDECREILLTPEWANEEE